MRTAESNNPIPAGFLDPHDHLDTEERWRYARHAEYYLRCEWRDDGRPGMLARATEALEAAGFNTTLLTIHCIAGAASVYPCPN